MQAASIADHISLPFTDQKKVELEKMRLGEGCDKVVV